MKQFTFCPPPCWRLTAWLITSPYSPNTEVSTELRASLLSRMTSLVVSAAMIFLLAATVAVSHPSWPLMLWAMIDGLLFVVRLASVAIVTRHRRQHSQPGEQPFAAVDVVVLAGVAWSLALGCGSGICLISGNPELAVLASLIAMGTIGGQCGRLPGAPRLVVAQICLVAMPFVIGGYLVPGHLIAWVVSLVPAYLATMISINRQLHLDYVEMIIGRQESRALALRCSLTGLVNRRFFDRSLTSSLGRSPSVAHGIYVLCLDIDGFKAVNDQLGHPAGDVLLQLVARRLLDDVPAGGVVARLGGDEFGMILDGCSRTKAEAVAQSIVAELRKPFLLDTHRTVTVGISVGIATASDDCLTADEIVSRADQALYTAKRAGKNTYRWSEEWASSDAARQTRDFLRDGPTKIPQARELPISRRHDIGALL